LESPSTMPALSEVEGLRTSELGVGTTIYFGLPLEIPSPALASDNVTRWFSPYAEYEYRMRTRRSKAPAPTVVPRFVVLEEGDTLRRLLARYLGDVELVPVKDIEAAATELNHLPAQALLVNASPFEGPPVPTDQLANLPYGTPVITCWVPGGHEAVKRLDVVHYLVKPVTREMLFSTLTSLGEGVKSVLLVDDNPEALQLFARMLASAERDYHILQATSGQRALNLLRARQARRDAARPDDARHGRLSSVAGKSTGSLYTRYPRRHHLVRGSNWRAAHEQHADRDPR